MSQGRNKVLKTEMHLAGYSTFARTRSPMKSRKFTMPPCKPKEDDIVESMNIVTLDMVPEDQRQRTTKIQAPSIARCTDCCADRDEKVFQSETQSVQKLQQRPTTLRDQTVCSCSGCMAS